MGVSPASAHLVVESSRPPAHPKYAAVASKVELGFKPVRDTSDPSGHQMGNND